MAFEQIFLVLLFLGLFGAVAWFIYRLEKKRAQELAAVAASLGLQFQKEPDAQVRLLAGGLDALPQGNSRNARFHIFGNYRGVDVRVFQYTYTTGSGKNRQTHHNAVAWALLPTLFPKLTIVPENVGHKLFDALGGDDIDFESDEFSRRFWVRCSDRKFAYDMIHGRMMEHLMAPGWQRWEIKGSLVVLWQQNLRLAGGHVQPALERIIGFIERFPTFLKPAGVTLAAGPAPIPSFSPTVAR